MIMTNFKNIKSVFVVCTGNICRSPMAEGVLRYKFDQSGLSHIQVNSAGTFGWDNHKPTSDAIQACSEIGVDISSLRSTPISGQMIHEADIAVAMQTHHIDEMKRDYDGPAEKLFLLGDFHGGQPGIEIKDPYGLTLSFYRNVLQIICQCADGLIDRISNN